MRIGLFSDCEGDVAALETALAALRAHTPDVLVHAGDILCCPFSPDPPAETIALLRAGSHGKGRVGYVVLTGQRGEWDVAWGVAEYAPRAGRR